MATRKPLEVHVPRAPPTPTGPRGELPRSTTVLLLVDVINPFDFPGSAPLQRAALVAARSIANLRQQARRRRWLTVYANDNYGRWRSDFRQTLEHCLATPGAGREVAMRLAPTTADLVLLKPRHSAFFATPLDLVLAQTHARRVIIGGFAADICVQMTAMDAAMRGFEVRVPADCTAAESPALKAAALRYLARVLQVDTSTSATAR
jgi:nicotinamidase-related amidase